MTTDLDVAVVGAGIAGLTLAHRLRATGRTVHVFEAADRVGGRMRTLRRDGWVVDTGAELLGSVGHPATWRLIRKLGLSDAEVPLIGGDLSVWRDGRAHPGFTEPRGLLTGAGLGVRAKLDLTRLLSSAGKRRRTFSPEFPEATPLAGTTVAELGRAYHQDVHDYLLQPLSAGFFGWDTDRASAGPLLAHLLAVGRSTTFRTYRDGMDTLAGRLAAEVDVSTGVAVREVHSGIGFARLVTDRSSLTARSVVLCVPGPVANAIHVNATERERDFLDACEFSPMLKVICRVDSPLPLPGSTYALLIPSVEDPVLSGVVLNHRKHACRSAAVSLLVGPAAVPELLAASDSSVIETVTGCARRYLPTLAESIVDVSVHRFVHGLPLPTARSLALRAEFVRRPVGTVDYAGDWVALRPSAEGAIRSAELTYARVLRSAKAAALISR